MAGFALGPLRQDDLETDRKQGCVTSTGTSKECLTATTSLQRLPVRSPHPGLKDLTRKLRALAQLRLQGHQNMLPTLAEKRLTGVLRNATLIT